jgi:hypothetical protein
LATPIEQRHFYCQRNNHSPSAVSGFGLRSTWRSNAATRLNLPPELQGTNAKASGDA